MLIPLLTLALAATAAAQPHSPERASQRAGEAYGLCLAAAARDHRRTTADMDAIMAHSRRACAAEGAEAKRTYLAYVRANGMTMSEADYERQMEAAMPQVRQRIAGCMETERLNAADGGSRRC